MLKLRCEFSFQHIVEMFELKSSAFKKLVNVDVLGDPSLRLQRLQEWILLGINSIQILPLISHPLSLRHLLNLLSTRLASSLAHLLWLGGLHYLIYNYNNGIKERMGDR